MLILYFFEEAGWDFVLLQIFGDARCATFVVVCGVHRALGVCAGAERAEIFHITTSELIKFLIRSIPFFRSRFKYCLLTQRRWARGWPWNISGMPDLRFLPRRILLKQKLILRKLKGNSSYVLEKISSKKITKNSYHFGSCFYTFFIQSCSKPMISAISSCSALKLTLYLIVVAQEEIVSSLS